MSDALFTPVIVIFPSSSTCIFPWSATEYPALYELSECKITLLIVLMLSIVRKSLSLTLIPFSVSSIDFKVSLLGVYRCKSNLIPPI